MRVSIIIPNYNGAKLLEKNIPSVLKAAKQFENTELIVIDDASTDNSKEVLSKFKEVHLLENSRNIGFARSINKGVGYSKGDIVVLLNSDVQPEEKFLEPLMNHFENEKVFAVGCLDKSIEDGKIVKRGRGVGKWSRGFFVHAAGGLDKPTTLWASGGSSAFRKSIWAVLGGFRTFYKPFYWEDIDLSYRAWKTGYEVDFESQSVVVHEHEEGSIKKQFSPFFIKTTAYKNQFLFAWSNIRNVGYILNHLIWLPYHLIRSLMSADLAFVFGFLKATLQIPEIIFSNSRLNYKQIKSDKEIINNFLE